MALVTVILFLIILFGLGSAVVRKEAAVMKVACGLAMLPVMGVVMNFFRLPLDWRIFLGCAIAALIFQFIRWRNQGGRISVAMLRPPSWQAMTVIAVWVFVLALYCWGPFQYPWLENDDSWAHAGSIKYVAIEKNLNAPERLFQYLNPYPPGYAIIIGLLHQIHPSLYWTLKFFNGFIISLGFLFFYFFVQEVSKDNTKAALSVFFLALIPCYLTHFIWAHALVVTLFFPAFYYLLKSFKDRQFILPAGIGCAAIFLTQPTQAIKFICMAGIIFSAYIQTGIRWKNMVWLIVLSIALAGLWWGPVLARAVQGRSHVLLRDGKQISGQLLDVRSAASDIFDPAGGTATRAYHWTDYFYIKQPNLINNPISIGPYISLFAIIGYLIFLFDTIKGKCQGQPKAYRVAILMWFLFTFIGMNSVTFQLPVGLFAFRFWMLFAIPVVLLSAEGFCFLANRERFRWNNKLLVLVLLIGVVFSYAPFKWRLNISKWYYGIHWFGHQDILGYLWMRKELPINSKVFAFTDNILVLGHDMRADFWRQNYQQLLGKAFEDDLELLYKNLRALSFDYLVLSPRDSQQYGREAVDAKLKSLYDDPRFQLIHSNEAVKIFKVFKGNNEITRHSKNNTYYL
jgi:hypothetical protein